MQHFDLVVIGAGMVGAALALGAAQKGKRVAIVEPRLPKAFDGTTIPDLRVSAISLSSQAMLQNFGAWHYIQAMRVHPYSALSVWDSFGRTHFSAAESGHEQMGYMVENQVLQLGLHQALQQCPDVSWFNQYNNLDALHGKMTLDGTEYSSDVIAAADGGNSQARAQAGIGVTGWQYQQAVLGITVKCDIDSMTDVAGQMAETWQAFSPTGPKAFLPLMNGYASLIWYDTQQQVKLLNAMSNDELQSHIYDAFPASLPKCTVLEKGWFPIARNHANRYYKGHLVLVGDAAHTINPLAGQGVNLGFKDVDALITALYCSDDEASAGSTLSSLLSAATLPLFGALSVDAGETPQTKPLHHALKQYEHVRRPHNLLMMSAMDAISSNSKNLPSKDG